MSTFTWFGDLGILKSWTFIKRQNLRIIPMPFCNIRFCVQTPKEATSKAEWKSQWVNFTNFPFLLKMENVANLFFNVLFRLHVNYTTVSYYSRLWTMFNMRFCLALTARRLGYLDRTGLLLTKLPLCVVESMPSKLSILCSPVKLSMLNWRWQDKGYSATNMSISLLLVILC